MYPQQIHSYLRQFFTENDCPILKDEGHYMDVQLTVDMDKKIMNRPYYWAYVESINDEPDPARLTFITDNDQLEEPVKGEVVHFGSPRLNQLFHVTKELGTYVQMYENVINGPRTQSILTPWLGVNYKVSYCCDRTKESLYSLGLNLMTGEVVNGFHESLSEVALTKTMPENTFNLPYTIKPLRGLERLDAVIDDLIGQDDHTWAEDAKTRWHRDRDVLEFFYEGVEQRPNCYEIEKKAIDQQYEAKIKIDILNGGLFYLR